MKRLLVLPILLALLLCGCAAKPLPLQADVQQALELMEIRSSTVTRLGDWQEMPEPTPACAVSDAEVEAGVAELLNRQSVLVHEEPRPVEAGDRVCIEYYWAYGDTAVSEPVETYLQLGLGEFDAGLEDFLLGQPVGQPLRCPASQLSAALGERVRQALELVCTVQYIYQIEQPALDEETVQRLFGVQSLEALYQSVHAQLEAEALAQAEEQYVAELFRQLAADSEFAISEEDRNAYGLYLHEGEIELAASLGYLEKEDFEVYLTARYGSAEAYYAALYTRTEEEIAYFLLIGAIAQQAGCAVTEENYTACVNELGFGTGALQGDNVTYARYRVIEQQVVAAVAGDGLRQLEGGGERAQSEQPEN